MKVLYGNAWRYHDFRDQRVAVIAPPEDAALVVPALVDAARSVKVFQDKPVWVLPVPLPLARTRLARLNLRLSVGDAWTRRLLTPHARYGRRDVVVSSAFYRALQQPHCKLIAWPVYAVVEHGVRTAEGIEHQVDTLVVTQRTHLRKAA